VAENTWELNSHKAAVDGWLDMVFTSHPRSQILWLVAALLSLAIPLFNPETHKTGHYVLCCQSQIA